MPRVRRPQPAAQYFQDAGNVVLHRFRTWLVPDRNFHHPQASTFAEFETCSQLFTDAISLNSGKAAYYFSRGKCFLALHQYQRALFDFSMAIRLDAGLGTNSKSLPI